MAWRDWGSVYRAAQMQAVNGEVSTLPHGSRQNTQHLMHDMREHWRNQGCSALHYQHGQCESAVLEHQRVAYEQVEIAAALATSRTAAPMASRFRDIENHVETNFQSSTARIIVRNYFRDSSGTRSSATRSVSGSYSDDAEGRPQSRGHPVKR